MLRRGKAGVSKGERREIYLIGQLLAWEGEAQRAVFRHKRVNFKSDFVYETAGFRLKKANSIIQSLKVVSSGLRGPNFSHVLYRQLAFWFWGRCPKGISLNEKKKRI